MPVYAPVPRCNCLLSVPSVCDCGSHHEAAQMPQYSYFLRKNSVFGLRLQQPRGRPGVLFKGGILSANITSESSVMYAVSTQFTEQVATTANTECMRLSCKTIVLAGQPLHYVADLNGSGKYVCGPCFNYTQIKHLQLFLVCSTGISGATSAHAENVKNQWMQLIKVRLCWYSGVMLTDARSHMFQLSLSQCCILTVPQWIWLVFRSEVQVDVALPVQNWMRTHTHLRLFCFPKIEIWKLFLLHCSPIDLANSLYRGLYGWVVDIAVSIWNWIWINAHRRIFCFHNTYSLTMI